MANHLTGAERYNRKMDKVWAQAKKALEEAEKPKYTITISAQELNYLQSLLNSEQTGLIAEAGRRTTQVEFIQGIRNKLGAAYTAAKS